METQARPVLRSFGSGRNTRAQPGEIALAATFIKA
jgi:hypothetical protein